MTGAAGDEQPSLSAGVGKALRWSAAGNVALRLGNLAVGIVLARILTPEEFGLYAIALAVQGVVMALADLGLSTDLIRNPDHVRRAPTVATLGIISGGLLALATALAAPGLASAMGGPEAAPAIAILALTFVLAGAGVTPFATLQRRLDQRSLFVTGAVDFVVGTLTTILLVLAGLGVVGLAVGRVVGQGCATVLQFVLARERPRFGFDRALVRPVLVFGLPIAGANLLSWAILGADKVVLGSVDGAVELGWYVLAFNISMWPMSLAGQALRSVVLPVFSRLAERARAGLPRASAVVWWFAALCGVGLTALADPVVVVVYGEQWAPAARILVPLCVLGALRILSDLFAGYLYARGYSRSVLVVQVVWVVALVPALLIGAQLGSSLGVAVAHVAVALGVLVPAYLVALRLTHDDVAGIVRSMTVPTIAGTATGLLGVAVGSALGAGITGGLVGGGAALVVYVGITGRWIMRRYRSLRNFLDTSSDDDVVANAVTGTGGVAT